MRAWIERACAVAAVLVFAAVASAGMMSVSGEVTKYEAGKAISVKDSLGMVHAMEITQETKVEGDVKVGAKVSVESDGKKARSVKAQAGG